MSSPASLNELLKSCGLENRAKLFEDEGYTLQVAKAAVRDDQATLLDDLRELGLPMDECRTFMEALAAVDNAEKAANQKPKPQPVTSGPPSNPQPSTSIAPKSNPPPSAATGPQSGPQPGNQMVQAPPVTASAVQPVAPQQAGPTTVVVQNNTVVNHNEVNITHNHNHKDTTSIMSTVHPIFETGCAYCALTPSVACSWTWQICCCNCTEACCKEAQEGCIINNTKCWINCTGCTLCKWGYDCCCLVGVCALPCHKDIPCRLTICYFTICSLGCPPCGCCKTVNHAKVMSGVHGAPENCEMER